MTFKGIKMFRRARESLNSEEFDDLLSIDILRTNFSQDKSWCLLMGIANCLKSLIGPGEGRDLFLHSTQGRSILYSSIGSLYRNSISVSSVKLQGPSQRRITQIFMLKTEYHRRERRYLV